MVNINSIIILCIILGVFIGCVFLQVYLSKKEERWKGFILPVLSLTISLLFLIGSLTYGRTSTSMQTLDENGTVVYEHVQKGNVSMNITGTCVVFAMYNLPTIIYLIIYADQKKKLSIKKQINKMNIQDI